MPTLIANYPKNQVVTKLKYIYSIMSQAMVSSQSESGDISEWDLGTTYDKENVRRIVQEHILPYIQYVDEGFYNNRYFVRLKNGILICFHLDGVSAEGKPPSVLRMSINLNNKIDEFYSSVGSPNTKVSYSRRTFELDFNLQQSRLIFFNWGGNTREGIMNNSVYKCNKDNPSHLRANCGALIFYDGWQIKDDYPW